MGFAKCSTNANAYARNKDVIGVIGTFNSGCAAIIIPILNRAPGGQVAMVSPANTYTGLTAAGPGTAAGEPNKYYPTGKRNYARVVAQDQYQGAADAILAKRVGAKNVYVLNDKEAYGLGVASNFRHAAAEARHQDRRLRGVRPEGIELRGACLEDQGQGCDRRVHRRSHLRERRQADQGPPVRARRRVKLLLPDGFTPISAVVEGAGAAAEGAWVSVAGLPNSKLTGKGRAFLGAFAKVEQGQGSGPVLGVRGPGRRS